MHGWVIAVQTDGHLVKTRIRIATDAALQAIKGGQVELSCGYTARLEPGKGVHETGERFDATQRDIIYNHLALVDLARAGPVARLHLDGARPGVRTQRPSESRGDMRKFKFKHDGKTYELPMLALAGIESAADNVGKRGDQVETGQVMIETSDGPVELVLPMATIEEMLSMVGAAPAPAAPEPTDQLEEETADLGLEEETDTLGLEEDAKKGPPKMDKAAIEKLIADGVTKALAVHETQRRDRADLERKAAEVLPENYPFSTKTDAQIATDAIVTLDETDKADAEALCARAQKGDAAAMGQLQGMLRSSLKAAKAATRTDHTGDLADKIFTLKRDGAPDAPSDNDVPSWEKARQDRLDRLSGKKAKDTDKASA
jgi:hypothetical protein